MLNWIKKLFGIKNTQTCPETQNNVVIDEMPMENAAHMVTPVVAEPVAEPVVVPEPVAVVEPVVPEPVAVVVEPVVVPEPVAVVEPVAAGKKPGKKEKKTPAKPKKKAETEIKLTVTVEEPVRKGRKTPADKPAAIKTTTVKSRKK